MARERSTIEEDTLTPRERLIEKTDKAHREAGLGPLHVSKFLGANALSLEEHLAFLKHNRNLNVKDAFTSNDKIVIHFNRLEMNVKRERKYQAHIATHKFGAKYAAKKFIEAVIHSGPTKWLNDKELYVADWFSITVDELSPTSLEKIMEYEYAKDEKVWKLPHPYTDYASNIRQYHAGARSDVNTLARSKQGLQRITPEELTEKGLRTPAAPKSTPDRTLPPEKKDRPQRARDKTPGLTTIATIATELKMTPQEARSILRKSKIEKPYAWSDADKEKITKILEKGRKR